MKLKAAPQLIEGAVFFCGTPFMLQYSVILHDRLLLHDRLILWGGVCSLVEPRVDDLELYGVVWSSHQACTGHGEVVTEFYEC